MKTVEVAIERNIRHLKRDKLYDVLGQGECQVSVGVTWPSVIPDKARAITDGTLLTVYRDPVTGKLWLRAPDEITADRFADLGPPKDETDLLFEMLGDGFDLASHLAVEVMGLQWTHGTDEEDHCDRYAQLQELFGRVFADLKSRRAPGHTDLMVSPEEIDRFVTANPPPAD